MSRAERALQNSIELFGVYECDIGESVAWNSDPSSGKQTPLAFAPSIDYRDFSQAGDAKVVWELNRHQHLMLLARAYRWSGDPRYAQKVVEQIISWADQCPFARGMNWRSPLELAIRLINWVWAIEFLAPSSLPAPSDAARIANLAYQHLWEITRKYSRHSSANNHLVGEAAGVFIGSSFLTGLPEAGRWRAKSHAILSQQIIAQTHADGGNRELAMGYHLFVLEFFLLAGLAGRRTGMDFAPEYWERLEKMFEYLAAFQEGGQTLPMFGDSDDGYVLDLGCPEHRARELLAVGAVLFQRDDFKSVAGEISEPAFWLLGLDGADRFEAIAANCSARKLASRAFPQSGYYLLQRGRSDGTDDVSVTFDCGELGFGSLAAHGHADALSFTLRALGSDVFVDPGTYDYFTDRGWRDHFRSTRSHNTVMIDGQDQSEMLGAFLWGERASVACRGWESNEFCTKVSGEVRMVAPSSGEKIHRRFLTLDHETGELIVRDELSASGEHTADFCFHLAEHCSVRPTGPQQYAIDFGRGRLVLHLDSRFTVTLYRGCPITRLGWVSRGYHRKSPAPMLMASCRWRDSLVTTTRIAIAGQAHEQGAPSDGSWSSRLHIPPTGGGNELKEACRGTA